MAHQLTINSTLLEELKAKAAALPEAGTGGVELPELTNPGVADDLVVGKQLIDGDGEVVTGTNPYEKATTDAEVNEQAALLAQAVTALENKVSVTPVLQIKEVTPSSSAQTLTPDDGYDGLSKVIVAGDENLHADNIADGVSIFGIIGTHKGSGGSGGSIETCTIGLVVDAPSPETPTVYSVDGNGSVQTTTFGSANSITVQKNTLITVVNQSSISAATSNIQRIYYGSMMAVYFVTGDGTLTYMG